MAQGVRKRGKTWSYYFDTAKINGKRHKIEKGGFRTQKEALNARAAAIAEYNDTGRVFSSSEISVSDYLDYWLENAIKKNIDHGYSYQTYLGYESRIRLYLKPAFGMYKLSNFQYSFDKVQAWVDDLKTQGLSRNTITNTLGCLKGAMNYAILPLGYIQSNPCLPVKIGKMPLDIQAKSHSEYICTKTDFDKILQRFPVDSPYHLALLVPYNIGTRIGETFAIDLKNDVDFENHEVNIKGQLVHIGDQWVIKPPKYDSYRRIKMGSTLENELKSAILQRNVNRLKYGPDFMRSYLLPDQSILQLPADETCKYTEIMPLCVTKKGKLLTPISFQHCAKIIHHDLDLPLFHSHCLRHTHGTILAENGINPKTVMERLGHKDISTTLQTYTFNTSTMKENAVDVFENANI